MTKKQFAKLLDVLKGIEEALQQLRLQNQSYIPVAPYVPYFTSYGPIADSQSEQNQ